MTSGQFEIVETSETVEIVEQVVQKMTYGRPETAEITEIVETSKITDVYTPLCLVGKAEQCKISLSG